MALIKSYKGLTPKWGRDCYFSENATIVGEVTMGDECSIWFNAVVRGDVAPITIGDRTNVQDGSCVHVTHETGPTVIGSDVTIGHNVTVHACTIHDHALIGMGCRILRFPLAKSGAAYRPNTSNPCVPDRRTTPLTTWSTPRSSCRRIPTAVSDCTGLPTIQHSYTKKARRPGEPYLFC